MAQELMKNWDFIVLAKLQQHPEMKSFLVGPQNWDDKSMEAEFEKVKLEDEDLGLKKIGLKIIKEAGKKGYPVHRCDC
uniref:Uncharacterized protein n=1 Tax=Acrobeloides nanus TaxID=290746 RepID=A0A914EBL8_9BILA